MGRSRSRTPSRKKSRRRSTSRSKHSKKSRHRTPDRKSSKYRQRSVSSSDSSSNRYKSSSSKYSSKRKKRDSKSPSRSRRHRRSTSPSNSSSRSSSSSSSPSKNSRRSSSPKNKPSSNYIEKIRAMRTPTPPKLNFDTSMEFLDKRQVSDSLAEINANEFRPKTFSSTTNSKGEKSDADLIKVKGEVRATKIDSNDDPLFHQQVRFTEMNSVHIELIKNLFLKVFGDDDARLEQWVHRLYTYRQKMFAPNN